MELQHGGNIYDGSLERFRREGTLLDFSANINPLGMPEGVRRAVTEALDQAVHYPDPLCRRLKSALSEYHKVPEDFLICGNGGADLIYLLAYALRPKRALLTAPTFSEYEEALKQTGTELLFYRMEADLEVRKDILEQMEQRPDVMFLCNPNNPTGILTDQELLIQILKKAEHLGIFLVLDECFLDFTGQEERSLIEETKKYAHLFILKSFTKMYAMPGIRLGYGISGCKDLLEGMERAGQCWGVSVLASEAGVAALREQEYKEKAVALVRKERKRMKEDLERLGLQVWDGQADYLFFRAPGITDLYERLLPEGILIRRCGNYRGLDGEYYRVAVKTRTENIQLSIAMEQALKKVASDGAAGVKG